MPNPQPTAAGRFASFLLHVIQGVAATEVMGCEGQPILRLLKLFRP